MFSSIIIVALPDMDKKGPIYSSHVSGEVIGVAVDESNTSPLLVYLLYVIILTYCCSESMNHDGYKKPYIILVSSQS